MDIPEDLKNLLRSMDEHQLKERAERLKEIEGPGGGGTEPRYYPYFITQANTEKELRLMVLQDSIFDLWNEAAMCYVDGQFRACIVLIATLLEATLKYELERQGIDFPELLTLGGCIDRCSRRHVLPEDETNPVTRAALKVNECRNDILHANIERHRPQSLFITDGPEHEVRPLRDPSRYIRDGALTGDGETISFGQGGLSIVYRYKAAAKNTLTDTEEVLKYLYPNP